MCEDEFDFVMDYRRYFEDLDELWKRATMFHETLRGNEDYIENRIILDVDEKKHLLSITQFKDSNTDIWVDHAGARKVPILRFEVKKNVN